MKESAIIRNAFAAIPEDVQMQVAMSYRIADNISHILEQKHLSASDLAKMTKREESEVRSWIGGGHDFNLSTLSTISTALNQPLLSVSRCIADMRKIILTPKIN